MTTEQTDQTTEQTAPETYAPGTPIWVDLATTDLDAAKGFYTALFGWEAEATPDPAAGGYTMLFKDGKVVAGLGPIMMEGQPPAWTTYVLTDNVDATVAKVTDAGGEVIAGPMDVFQAGRLAVFMDPTGAVFAVWQAWEHKGAQLFNAPGSLVWNELYSRDITREKEFYGKVFGWTSQDDTMPDGSVYTQWKVGDRGVAGGLDMTSIVPEPVPAHWLVYFMVDSAADSLRRAQELGGKDVLPVKDIGFGEIAIAQDPQGALFAVMSVKPQG